MKRHVLAALLLAVPAAGQPPADPAAAAPAVEPAQAAEPVGPLPRLTASVDTTRTSVGGPLLATLRTEPVDGWLVDAPTKATKLEGFQVRSVERLAPAEGAGWRMRLIAVEAGEVALPAVTLTARGPAGATAQISSAPVLLTVASNLPAPPAEAEEPADPEPAALKPPLEPPRDWLPLLVAVAAAVVAAVLGFWLLRRWRGRDRKEAEPEPERRRPLRPAWETALEQLDRIAEADYVGRGELGRQYVEVTTTLRQYLEDRYGVPALESTTTDLNEHLRRSPVRTEMSSRILSLLREADLVKFAKAQPEPSEARSSEARARDVVMATIPGDANGEAPA